MEIKQLKASLQLAQMRYQSDNSESNLAVLNAAHAAFQLAAAQLAHAQAEGEKQIDILSTITQSLQNFESPKIEQVSGESENTDVPEDTDKTGDVAGDIEPTSETPENSDKSDESAATPALISAPSTTDAASEAVPAAESEEKKTEDSPAPQE